MVKKLNLLNQTYRVRLMTNNLVNNNTTTKYERSRKESTNSQDFE